MWRQSHISVTVTYLWFVKANQHVHQSFTETTSVICSDFPFVQQKGDLKNSRLVEGSRGKQKHAKICPIAGPLETFEKMVGVFRKRINFLRFTFSPLEVSTAFNPLQMRARLSKCVKQYFHKMAVLLHFPASGRSTSLFFTAPKIKSHWWDYRK